MRLSIKTKPVGKPSVFGKFTFDLTRPKGECPSCGVRGKWRYYKEEDSENQCPDEYGICDRTSCGHRAYPSYDYEANPTLLKKKKKRGERVFMENAYEYEKTRLPELRKKNGFYKYLVNQFGKKEAKKVFNRMRLGTMPIMDKLGKIHQGATVFWVFDEKGRIEGGEVILIDPKTGSTVKGKNWYGSKWVETGTNEKTRTNGRASQPWHYQFGVQKYGTPKAFSKAMKRKKCKDEGLSWFHRYVRQGKQYKPNGRNYTKNWFGLHQFETVSPKAIKVVESAKTAVYMTICQPQYVWIATQSMNRLRSPKQPDSKGSRYDSLYTVMSLCPGTYIYIVPDANGVKRWNPNLLKTVCWESYVIGWENEDGKIVGGVRNPLVILDKSCKPSKIKRLGISSGSDIMDVWRYRLGDC